MATRSCMLVIMTMVVIMVRGVEGFWWPFSNDDTDEQPRIVAIQEAKEPVAFEMATAEQKFLAEAQQYLNLSPLEACQYQVVHELRESCGNMGEEELGKMAVALLNCQSQAENRRTFTCTDEMTLAECTADMDPSVWNAYHIISNRARSVCYSTRQQQFHRQTEAAVNQLSSSTLQQIQAMSDLSRQQSEVKQLAQSSLETLLETQQEAEVREREIAARQEGVKEKIAANLEHLAREKVLISSGQQLLANMTGDIKAQLEVASEMLGSQEQHLKESQKEILDDISTVRENIHGVWGRIDNRTSQLLSVLQDITDHYQDTLDSLRVINETLGGMQSMVEGMSVAVHGQLDWVIGQLGGANTGLRVLTSCVCHGLFLLAGMLVVVFLKVPAPARFFLLVAVVTNVVFDVRMGMALTYSALATMATIVVLLNVLYNSIRHKKTTVSSATAPTYLLPRPPPHEIPTYNDHTLSTDNDDSIDYDYNDMKHVSNGRHASRDLTPQFMAAETLSSTPSKHLPTTNAASSGPIRCVAMTNSGMQCRLRSIPGAVTCHRHS